MKIPEFPFPPCNSELYKKKPDYHSSFQKILFLYLKWFSKNFENFLKNEKKETFFFWIFPKNFENFQKNYKKFKNFHFLPVIANFSKKPRLLIIIIHSWNKIHLCVQWIRKFPYKIVQNYCLTVCLTCKMICKGFEIPKNTFYMLIFLCVLKWRSENSRISVPSL